MNESSYRALREKSWRGKLTQAETAELQAWLAEHPEVQDDWEAETCLTEAMGRLPDAPVPTNFTARVLQALERESVAGRRSRVPARVWLLRAFLPRAAAAAFVLGVGLFTYREHAVAERRAELVRDLKTVSSVRSLPSPEILQDFDTIQKMSAANGPDQELLQDVLALKK